ncbi:hypothetical protein EG327_000674 [Venturia inaequalis]|uniref:Rhodopsin domain-containing protein n=1 Tax=Venturia inaequalis TaxID=5025 RepID=A0A8H3VM68_VENIN|nr:hypothetical protein EG327_000674 [Venturia inaequalis]
MSSTGSAGVAEMARQSQTKAPQQIAAVSVFLPLALGAVAFRLWIRTRMVKSLGWDDYMMVVALMNFIVYSAALIIIVANGGGTHIKVTDTKRTAVTYTLVAEVFYLMTIMFLKISLGLFFLRVVSKKWQRKVVYATMFLSTIINIYHTVFVVFSCGSPQHYLERMIQMKCVRKSVELGLAYEQAAVTTITDFVFALLPLPLLWNLSMDRRSKTLVGCILGLGTLGSIFSIVRFKYIDGLGSHEDFFWNAANVSIWSTMEMGTGIIAGCLATMRPLFKKLVYKASPLSTSHRGATDTSSRLWKPKPSARSSTHTDSRKSLQDWKQNTDVGTGTFTTTIVGGVLDDLDDLDDEKGMGLVQIRDCEREFPEDVWSTDPETSRIWPFAVDAGISKTVDVKISVSQEEPISGGLWGKRMEDIIQSPKQARHSGSSADSIPEWDRLPDLIMPSRSGSKGSGRGSPVDDNAHAVFKPLSSPPKAPKQPSWLADQPRVPHLTNSLSNQHGTKAALGQASLKTIPRHQRLSPASTTIRSMQPKKNTPLSPVSIVIGFMQPKRNTPLLTREIQLLT